MQLADMCIGAIRERSGTGKIATAGSVCSNRGLPTFGTSADPKEKAPVKGL